MQIGKWDYTKTDLSVRMWWAPLFKVFSRELLNTAQNSVSTLVFSSFLHFLFTFPARNLGSMVSFVCLFYHLKVIRFVYLGGSQMLVHQNHRDACWKRLLDPRSRTSDSVGLRETCECACPTSFLVLLAVLNQGPLFWEPLVRSKMDMWAGSYFF